MRMPRRPCRHGAGNPQIIMPAAQTIIEPASFLIHDLEISQLPIGPTAHLIIRLGNPSSIPVESASYFDSGLTFSYPVLL